MRRSKYQLLARFSREMWPFYEDFLAYVLGRYDAAQSKQTEYSEQVTTALAEQTARMMKADGWNLTVLDPYQISVELKDFDAKEDVEIQNYVTRDLEISFVKDPRESLLLDYLLKRIVRFEGYINREYEHRKSERVILNELAVFKTSMELKKLSTLNREQIVALEKSK